VTQIITILSVFGACRDCSSEWREDSHTNLMSYLRSGCNWKEVGDSDLGYSSPGYPSYHSKNFRLSHF